MNGINLIKEEALTFNKIHEQKLQDRLARLKVWREQKKASDQNARAKKKIPFVVPGLTRSSKLILEANTSLPFKHTERVTRSQVKKVELEKQWTVTSTNKGGVQEERVIKNAKVGVKSFAPKGFMFTAPTGNKARDQLFEFVHSIFLS